MKHEIEIEDGLIPDDMEVVGFKRLEPGDGYMGGDGKVYRWTLGRTGDCSGLVVRKKPWRSATIDDLKRYSKSGPVKARFKKEVSSDWIEDYLVGWSCGLWRMDGSGEYYTYCEIFDIEKSEQ